MDARAALLLLLLGSSACSSAHAEPGACDLHVTTKVVAKGRLRYAVQAQIENVSKHSVRFALQDRCPGRLVEFEGLPDNYDYYQTCNAGACSGEQGVQLAPGERKQLAAFELTAEGGACNAPLESALYQLRPRLPKLPYNVCVDGALLDLRNTRIPSKPDFTACTRSDECVISCPGAPGCCGQPCGCTNAIRRDQVASYARSFAKTCKREPQCPPVGCAYQSVSTAVCRDGHCVAEPGLGL